MKARCSSCQAEILWTVTENGKRMPVDAKPIGKVTVLVRNPENAETPISKQREHFISHFATCPHAQRHRKPPESPTT